MVLVFFLGRFSYSYQLILERPGGEVVEEINPLVPRLDLTCEEGRCQGETGVKEWRIMVNDEFVWADEEGEIEILCK